MTYSDRRGTTEVQKLQVPRSGVWLSITGSLTLILAACSGAPPAAAPTDARTNAPSLAPSLAATAPAPAFSSSTEAATTAPDGAVVIEIAGPPGHFDPKTVTATAGDVVFYLDNTSPGVHDMAIDRVALTFEGDEVTNVPLAMSNFVRHETSAIFTVDGLPAGTYVFWCTIDNHAAEGMTGSLIVTP
jgi:plastocyanin